MKMCFVCMPLTTEFEPVFNEIKDTLRGQWECIKADEKRSTGLVTDKVVKYMLNADLVIAVVPDPREGFSNNPNVMYELGIAHSFRKPTILLADHKHLLPFDLRSVEAIELDFSRLNVDSQDFLRELRQELQDLLQGNDIHEGERGILPRNPVTAQLSGTQVFVEDLSWLWGYRKVLERERSAKTIWEITRDLFWPGERLFFESIRSAIQKKRKHYFMVPDDDGILQKVEAIKKQLRACGGGVAEESDNYLRFVRIEQHYFDLWPIAIVLYDADLATSREGIICEPMTSEVGHDLNDEEVRRQFDEHAARSSGGLDTFHLQLDWFQIRRESTFDISLDGRVVDKLATAFAKIWDEKIWTEIRQKTSEQEESLLKTWLIRG